MTLAVLAAAPASAGQRYLGVFVGSQHIGSDAYNDFNPGLTYGYRWPVGTGSTEWHVEGGVFFNSYEEVSPIAVVGLSTGVAELGGGEIRLGASVGIARYAELSEIVERKYDIPTFGDYLPVAALTGSYRRNGVAYRLSVLPYGEDVEAVVNFSLAFDF
ncbi:hypothetical protein [Jannaschia ovalis]|uniref:Lipid A 3-O-deacylase (PagL) n=1 Tax=Jannaschia ovalis TaxID=3038773 RepID=A0ABY8LBV4_9RHOB|nr:hypothetical protein [Jannaschia sp. GRR-S6-38]WGH77668.1 hypothetical protein P8627_11525 [Jannaschia sp. GRR-S6-38]